MGRGCLPASGRGWHSMSYAYEAPFFKFGNKSLFMELFCRKPVCWCGASSRVTSGKQGQEVAWPHRFPCQGTLPQAGRGVALHGAPLRYVTAQFYGLGLS